MKRTTTCALPFFTGSGIFFCYSVILSSYREYYCKRLYNFALLLFVGIFIWEQINVISIFRLTWWFSSKRFNQNCQPIFYASFKVHKMNFIWAFSCDYYFCERNCINEKLFCKNSKQFSVSHFVAHAKAYTLYQHSERDSSPKFISKVKVHLDEFIWFYCRNDPNFHNKRNYGFKKTSLINVTIKQTCITWYGVMPLHMCDVCAPYSCTTLSVLCLMAMCDIYIPYLAISYIRLYCVSPLCIAGLMTAIQNNIIRFIAIKLELFNYILLVWILLLHS